MAFQRLLRRWVSNRFILKGDFLLICPELVVIIQGGLVDGIYSSHRKLRAVVIDWDVFDGDAEVDPKVTHATHQGRTLAARVAPHCVNSLHRLKGSDAEAVLLASGEDG